ncbi:hypothetical protein BFW01_g1680 [Lasiodiplodia theobromae]|uniref:Uncharacterized protein n=1 Tax=Lasiodiplodia theobromae TaxID=45133 RepID=A0A5N5D566_9PEZI|nr:hypothetical protein DBV05_g8616 [Lasiodiplodia theobromae]KAF9641697.1 hypothetical protein BFW01_g1680 [Lasiodiplodia theobromae]
MAPSEDVAEQKDAPSTVPAPRSRLNSVGHRRSKQAPSTASLLQKPRNISALNSNLEAIRERYRRLLPENSAIFTEGSVPGPFGYFVPKKPLAQVLTPESAFSQEQGAEDIKAVQQTAAEDEDSDVKEDEDDGPAEVFPVPSNHDLSKPSPPADDPPVVANTSSGRKKRDASSLPPTPHKRGRADMDMTLGSAAEHVPRGFARPMEDILASTYGLSGYSSASAQEVTSTRPALLPSATASEVPDLQQSAELSRRLSAVEAISGTFQGRLDGFESQLDAAGLTTTNQQQVLLGRIAAVEDDNRSLQASLARAQQDNELLRASVRELREEQHFTNRDLDQLEQALRNRGYRRRA